MYYENIKLKMLLYLNLVSCSIDKTSFYCSFCLETKRTKKFKTRKNFAKNHSENRARSKLAFAMLGSNILLACDCSRDFIYAIF